MKPANQSFVLYSGKRVLTLVLAVAILLITFPTFPVAAAVAPSIDLGNASITNGQYYYANATITGDNIRTILISFSDAVADGDEIILPASTPAGFTISASSNTYTKRINLSTGIASSTVQTYIRSIGYTIASPSLSVDISLTTEIIPYDTFYNIDTKHYYQYVSSTKDNWIEAYAAAKSMTYMGRSGYLATVTSKNEDTHINSLSGGKTGWLGGTILRNSGTKVNSSGGPTGNLLYYSSIETTSVVSTGWYWANGPEIGTTFYNVNSLDSATTDPTASTAATIDGNNTSTYYNWARGTVSYEPNNRVFETSNSEDKGPYEACLTTLEVDNNTGKQGTIFSWNDKHYSDLGTGVWNVQGFFVEYGDLALGDSSEGDISTAYATDSDTLLAMTTAASIEISFDSSTNASTATILVKDLAGSPKSGQSLAIYLDGKAQAGTFLTGDTGTLDYNLIDTYGGTHILRVTTGSSVSQSATFKRISIDSTDTNAIYSKPTPVFVDSGLQLLGFSEQVKIPGARVSIENYQTGDVLTAPGKLPIGVTSEWNASIGALVFSGDLLAMDLQTLLRNITFSTTSGVTTTRTISFTIGDVLPGASGHFYDYVASEINWTNAKAAAASKSYLGLNGYLATITSDAENELIADKLQADAWIGASDSYNQINLATGSTTYANQAASEGNWYWVTGPEAGTQFSDNNYPPTELTYMNWRNIPGSQQPDNYWDSTYKDYEHYGEIYASTGEGTWNDLPDGTFSSVGGYVVEYGGMNEDPILNLSATRSVDMVFTYAITYLLDGGTNYTGAPVTYTNASDTIVLGTPTKQGYTFTGWYDAATGGHKVTSLATGSTGDKTFYARWTAATNTAYTVEHYHEKVDGTGYDFKESDNETGTTGATVTATAATYTGFAENTSASGRIASGTVAADGSLVLKLYYDRIEYTVTFEDHDGEALGTDQVVYEAGATAPSPAPSRTGYTFTGWSPSYTSITSDLTVTAQYAANTDTAYKIEHYQQDVTGSGYTLTETDKMTGTTASSVTASAKTYAGFSENTSIASRVASGTIAADGSLVLKLYYDRNTVSVSFVDHDDSELSQQTVRYAGSATPPAKPARAGYTFAGWSGYYTEVKSDQTVTATYTANLNTPYLVKHYQQNVADDDYTLKDTDELSGETDTKATALAKEYEGFSENTSHSDQVLSGMITGDGKLVLKLYYDRDKVTVTFKDFDTKTVLKTETVRYEGSVTPPADPTRLGYTFNGWNGTYNSVSSDQTVLATYSPNTSTRYKVEHYQQDVRGDGYTLKETENLTGTTDTTATATAKTYAGFAENTTHTSRIASGNVAADESLVLKLYYDRLTYVVTFRNHDDSMLKEETIRFEGNATPPDDPTRTGYTFHSWDGDYTGVKAAQTIKATFTANINTIYTVEHYQQNIKDDGYTLEVTEVLSGTTDTAATAIAKTFTGFLENTTHDDRMSTGNIDGDGSRVLKLFYDRKTYTVTFKNHDNSVLENETVRYGGDATPPADPIRAGYTFLDWNGTYASITKSETVWAVFSAITTTPYRVLHYLQDVTGDGYTLTTEENLTGTTDTSASATVSTLTGFHEDTSHVGRVISGQIAGDGSLVLKVYYARDVFTVNFVDTNGNVFKSEAVRYQGNATPPGDPRRVRYNFTGWDGNYRNIQQNEIVKATFSIIKLTGSIEVEPLSSSLFDHENASLIAAPELWNSNVESVIYYIKDIQITDITNRFQYLGFAADHLKKSNHLLLQVYDLTLMKRVTWLDGQITEDPVDNTDLMGNITVRLPLAPGLAGYSGLQIVFIDDAGNIAFLPTTIVVENGQKYLEFENNHFSLYAVAASSSLPPIPATSDVSTSAISPFLATVYGIAILLLGLVLAWYRWMNRRRRDKNSITG